jgi:heptosyltransferase-2
MFHFGSHDLHGLSEEEAGAQGCFVILRRGKRRIIRIIETLLYPIIRAWERLRQPSPGDSQGIKEILVIEYSLLGDIVLLLPFLNSLKRAYPAARITLLVHPSVAELLKNNHPVKDLVCVRMPWVEHLSRARKWNPFSPLWLQLASQLKVLRRRQFDLAFSVRGDVRDNFLLWITGATRRIGYAFGGGGFLLTDRVQPNLSHPHISERWLRFLEHLGKPISESRPRLLLAYEELERADQYLKKQGIKDTDLLVGIHPKARVPTRRWSEDKFRSIAERLHREFAAKVLWFSDPRDQDNWQDIKNGVLPVRLPLRDFMAVLARCKLLICNDGGQMHIATAVQVPVIAVFGSTEPNWYGPIGERNRVVIQPSFWCRPCAERCVFDQPYCIQTIPVEAVWRACSEVLADLVLAKPRRDSAIA